MYRQMPVQANAYRHMPMYMQMFIYGQMLFNDCLICSIPRVPSKAKGMWNTLVVTIKF